MATGSPTEPMLDYDQGYQPHDEAARFAALHGLSDQEAERLELGRGRDELRARCVAYIEYMHQLATRIETCGADKVKDPRRLRQAAMEFRAEIGI